MDVWCGAQVLAPCAPQININGKIMALYLNHLLPAVTMSGDDSNYGSCAMYDVLVLQARPSTSQWLTLVERRLCR